MKTRIVLVLLVGGLVWFYFPPLGATVERPDLEAFFRPDVPHGNPVFIDTGSHVYYRVRLNAIVGPGFTRTYFESLRKRGIQFVQYTSSPFAPFHRAKGWQIASATENTLRPCIVNYWKSTDLRTASFPISLRWPWLYVRLGRDVLKPVQQAVVVPVQDVVLIHELVPRYPGSVVTEAYVHGNAIQVIFTTEASADEIGAFFEGEYGAFTSVSRVPSFYSGWFKFSESIGKALGVPLDGHIDIDSYLFADHPLVIYSAHAASRIGPDAGQQQPEGLKHLPPVVRYTLRLRYGDDLAAASAGAMLLPKR